MAVLIGMSGDLKGKKFTLDQTTLTIGRAADNTIPLNNPAVSGHHCSISHEGDHFILRDLGSTNGTRVNAKDVKEITLKPKDLIQVGAVELLYNDETDAAPPETGVFASTQVDVAQGAIEKPQSFDSISPFGARRKENTRLLVAVIVIIGVLAIGVVGYFVYKTFIAE
jgi:pSer/pThr/pTyr-binding forkhead associated (FHA) protein